MKLSSIAAGVALVFFLTGGIATANPSPRHPQVQAVENRR